MHAGKDCLLCSYNKNTYRLESVYWAACWSTYKTPGFVGFCGFFSYLAKNFFIRSGFDLWWCWKNQEQLVTWHSSVLWTSLIRMSYRYGYRSRTSTCLSFLLLTSPPPAPVSLDNLSFVWTECQVSIAPRHYEGKDIVPSGFAGLLRKEHWSASYVSAAQIFILITQATPCTHRTRQVTCRDICITSHKIDALTVDLWAVEMA